ncbi:hypothetical protein EV385_1630 [Krasilnikovia cinnamomea]|uniref:Uncharacterized protein n=1 Tax=Krasilnikovia cinnamomea TaxID=349313 RepID=A0A4Q7ZI19_9ACTN|nr:DUF6232 family protein [Krasilnikovia cinnamomea]RZU49873.1 hypothetical protein EV385_1630 [Krasilnikovia cinnamomea]
MITYYRDPEVVVTSARIRIGGHDYRPDDLDLVWHRRGPRSWTTVAGRGAAGMLILVPVLLGALGVLLALILEAPAATTIILGGGGVLLGLAAVPTADVVLDRVDRSYDRGSRPLQIWGRVRGTDVLLLNTTDRRRFGQIYRALQRALESGPVKR